MRTETLETIQEWFTEQGLKVTENGALYFAKQACSCDQLSLPKESQRALTLARAIATVGFEEELQFPGAFLWVTSSDSLNPINDRIGLKLIEALRRSNGEQRALETSPGHWFRGDEFTTYVAFLFCCLLFGWDAYTTTLGGERYFFHIRTAYMVSIADVRDSHRVKNDFERFGFKLEASP